MQFFSCLNPRKRGKWTRNPLQHQKWRKDEGVDLASVLVRKDWKVGSMQKSKKLPEAGRKKQSVTRNTPADRIVSCEETKEVWHIEETNRRNRRWYKIIIICILQFNLFAFGFLQIQKIYQGNLLHQQHHLTTFLMLVSQRATWIQKHHCHHQYYHHHNQDHHHN